MHQNEIIARVNKLYSKTEKKGNALSEFHCDYLKLENAMKFYNKNGADPLVSFESKNRRHP